ncbi:MAG: bifunctional aspartate kinase/homoserine dehydrogenase I [Candidatus Cyclobacteriaceae bacterium M3_2C_046]
MKILKFGGTSVGSLESLENVLDIISNYHKRDIPVSVVVSAMGGVTNLLIEAGSRAAASDEGYSTILKTIEDRHFTVVRSLIEAKMQSKVMAQIKFMFNELEDLLHGVFLLKELSPRTLDLVQSFGERCSAYMISQCLVQKGIPAHYLDARQLIKTDKSFGKAKVNFKLTNTNIQEYFSKTSEIQLITGFIGSTDSQETTTIGRGGSDYTAAIFAAALQAQEIEIWTDVDGVMTADPRKVKSAFTLPSISYSEAMEMSHFGAKVIYPPTLQPAFGAKIPIRIRNTFNPAFEGTLISQASSTLDFPVKGISSIQDISLVNLIGSGMVGVPGIASRLFGVLASHHINVILITQASSEHSICFAVSPQDSQEAKQIIEEEFAYEMQYRRIDQVIVEEGLSIVAIIGENMRNTVGISGKMLNALGKNGINVVAIAQGSSELNISVVMGKPDLSKALNALHEAFFLSDIKTLNLFLVGTGLIGGTLLNQIEKQFQYLYKEQHLKINIVGITNSRKMYFDEAGIPLQDLKWKTLLDQSAQKADLEEFIREIKQLNLPNSVFIDCTASQGVINFYPELLKHSVSIVTPSKLANSGSYQLYKTLRDLAYRHGAKFLYETNVGAGLPVISTLNDLKHSGDRILKIEGVLSGTLSYIFNNFQANTSFSEIVKTAKQFGYTEPDPRDDLNGMDVSRKILILAREVGLNLEPDDVIIENILPDACLKASSVEEFFDELENNNQAFEQKRQEAEQQNQVLRYIAKLENNQVQVSLVAVDQQHPFYGLSGSDNIVSFTTARYKERPLVVKGPGAGAEVTAAGVFADIISISNYLSNR